MFKSRGITIFDKIVFIAALALGLILEVNLAFASIDKLVANRDLVTLTISAKDPNIIAIKNDRIKQYSVVKGIITANIDSNLGVLNLKPAEQYSAVPFSMIIFTEKGYRYTLLLVPKKVPAQDIVLNNKELNIIHDIAKPSDNNAKIALIKAMIKGDEIAGYKRELITDNNKDEHTQRAQTNNSLADKDKFNFSSDLELSDKYIGSDFTGEIGIFKNLTDINLTLKEEDFAGTNAVVVALSAYQVAPLQTIKVYRVVRNG